MRDGALVVIAFGLAHAYPRAAPRGQWLLLEPIHEVAFLFAGIFVIPVLAAPDSPARRGPWLLDAVTRADGRPREVAYFWLAGALSAFLENAPFVGALTYFGNAPNFMIYAIASARGVRMPSLFGYLVWSSAVLIPVFLLLTFVFVGP